MTEDRRSYTTKHVADRLGVSLQTVQRWVDAGHLKAWKTLGGHRRIDAQSADALFKSQDERIGPPLMEPSDVAAAPVSVLIVDDDRIALDLLSNIVREALPQARIHVAENGFQALSLAGREMPDVVITDIQMPHMDGVEMIRHLMHNESSAPRMVLAVTALSATALAAKGPLPDGVRLFRHPVDRQRIIAMLRGEG